MVADTPELPLVTVITPSRNMGRFLRETIESVLSQDYPRIEYIVMDGGSTDNTLDILREYADRLQYWSKPDQGTADAINQGFRRSSGSILGWLNADDTYLPGAISTAVATLLAAPEAAVVYGDGYWVDREGRTLGPYPTHAFDANLFRSECYICQPAAFIRRSSFEAAGMLDPALSFTFDYDLWIRIGRLHPMRKIDAYLATSRMHAGNKTVGQKRAALRETLTLLRRQYGYVPCRWVEAYACNLADGRDQFFEPMQPSILKYVFALLLGLGYNARHPLQFAREWASVLSLGAITRRMPRWIGLP